MERRRMLRSKKDGRTLCIMVRTTGSCLSVPSHTRPSVSGRQIYHHLEAHTTLHSSTISWWSHLPRSLISAVAPPRVTSSTGLSRSTSITPLSLKLEPWLLQIPKSGRTKPFQPVPAITPRQPAYQPLWPPAPDIGRKLDGPLPEPNAVCITPRSRAKTGAILVRRLESHDLPYGDVVPCSFRHACSSDADVRLIDRTMGSCYTVD